jgi:hypothetical protein
MRRLQRDVWRREIERRDLDRQAREIGVGVDPPDQIEPGRRRQGNNRGLDDALRRAEDRMRRVRFGLGRRVKICGCRLSKSLMNVQSDIPRT